MSNCCSVVAHTTRKRIEQLETRLAYILSKDNPYFRIFGTESERMQDADWTREVIKRLRQIQVNNLCKCTQN
jgi:predicted methyltransferase